MKANEAPEKIWMNDDWVHQFDVKEFMGEDSIEYIRTDAFIEKACEWLDKKDERDSYTIGYIKKHLEEIIKEIGL